MEAAGMDPLEVAEEDRAVRRERAERMDDHTPAAAMWWGTARGGTV
jgi:hypothetical protein